MKKFIVTEVFAFLVAGVFLFFLINSVGNFIYYFCAVGNVQDDLSELLTGYGTYSALSLLAFALSLTAGILIAVKELSALSPDGIPEKKKMLLTVFSELCLFLVLALCAFFGYSHLVMLTQPSLLDDWIEFAAMVQTILYGSLFVICSGLTVAAWILSLHKSRTFFGKSPKS